MLSRLKCLLFLFSFFLAKYKFLPIRIQVHNKFIVFVDVDAKKRTKKCLRWNLSILICQLSHEIQHKCTTVHSCVYALRAFIAHTKILTQHTNAHSLTRLLTNSIYWRSGKMSNVCAVFTPITTFLFFVFSSFFLCVWEMSKKFNTPVDSYFHSHNANTARILQQLANANAYISRK